MSSVDNRVVKMEFDNAQFKKGAADSKKSLDDINKAVDAAGKSKGLLDLNSNMKTVGVTASKTSIVVTAALATITAKATAAGLTLAKSLTIDPVRSGFKEYEKLLTSAQTIRANTGSSLQKVNDALDDLNHYSDQTIYNFGQMADNIGKFTAAGVKIDVATASIKGLANTAALAGSTTDQLNTAMYQMSQALASGSIKLMDWNSLVNAGMGGKNQQKLFKETATAMGLNVDSMVKKAGSFRESLKDGWLTSDVFSHAMQIMSGHVNKAGDTVAYTAAELRKMGYAKDAAKQLSRLSAAAIDSATKIKTFSQGIDVVKEAVGSGWAQIFRSLFGNLDESISMWTKVFNVITGGINTVFNAIAGMLDQWRALGGYNKLWGALGNIFQSIGNVLKPFVALFKALLPAGNGAGNMLYSLTDALFQFSVWLEKVTSKTEALIPVFTIIGLVLRDVATRIFGLIAKISNIDFTWDGFKNAGKDLITGLIKGLTEWAPKVIGIIVGIAVSLWEAFASYFGIHSPSRKMKQGGNDLMHGLANGIREGIIWVGNAFKDAIRGIGDGIGWLANLAGQIDWDRVFDIAKMLILLEILRTLYVNLNRMTKAFANFAGGFAKFGEGVANMGVAMKRAATAQLLKSLAITMAVFVASLWVLSKIPEAKLRSALISLAEAMAILVVGFVAISRFVNSGGVVSVTKGLLMAGVGFAALGAGLIELGVGLLIFKLVKPDEMKKAGIALGAVAGGLLALSAIGKGNVLGAGKALLAVAVGLVALGQALIIFKLVKPEEMYKAAGALVVLTGALVVLSRFAPNAIKGSAGLVIMAFGLGVLAAAIFPFFLINWEDLFKAAAALTIVGAAGIIFGKMIQQIVPGAIGMAALALGITALAGSLLLFQLVDWATIAKGLTALLLLGTITALAGLLIEVLVPGAVALVAMALGIAAFAGSLLLLQQVDWATIGKGIVSLLAFGTVGVVLGVVSPLLFAAGAGLLVFAAGLVAATAALIVSAAAIDYFWNMLSSTFGGITDWVKNLFGIHSPSSVFADIGLNLILGLLVGIGRGVGAVLTIMGNFAAGIFASFTNGLGDVVSWGANIALGIAQGIVNYASHPWNAAMDMAKGIAKGITGFFGIHSPSTLMAGYGKNLMDGFTNGIDGNSGGVMNSISGVMNGINGIIANGVNTGKGYINSLLTDYNNARAATQEDILVNRKTQNGNGASPSAAASSPVATAIKPLPKVTIPKVGGGGGSSGGGGGGGSSKAKSSAASKKAKAKQKAAAAKQKVLDARQKAVDAIEARADARDAAIEAAAAAAERKQEFDKASSAVQAKMRSEDAQNQLQKSRDAADQAAEDLAQAKILEAAAKKKGTTKAQAAAYRAQGKKLRDDAAAQTKAAETYRQQSAQSAADSLTLQMKTADEFQAAYEQAAKDDADAHEFEKKTDAEKAVIRRQQAADLQKKADEDLAKAKQLAFTDLDAANALAAQAMDEAQKARDYVDDALDYEASSGTGAGGAAGTVINLTPTDMAAAGFDYGNLYDTALAAAGSGPTYEFNQYNTSPEALTPSEIYRQTNNQLAFASDKIASAA